ncbi:uncharacterized protein G2W53_005014 [Senna tora]|uniref:Uncharacterized protein n=1 Tax=Senna tora TaxID=362788 RepID=A0A835CIQ0_9FABA|nr:uncharacterized protein G2W53_005014 [Senna tora]
MAHRRRLASVTLCPKLTSCSKPATVVLRSPSSLCVNGKLNPLMGYWVL